MTRLFSLFLRDLTDPFGLVITTMLLVCLIILSMLAGAVYQHEYDTDYIVRHPDARTVGAEDDCAFGTKDVRRIGNQLYCIGEP